MSREQQLAEALRGLVASIDEAEQCSSCCKLATHEPNRGELYCDACIDDETRGKLLSEVGKARSAALALLDGGVGGER